MSHSIPGHDYSERHKEESLHEYAKRKKMGMSPKTKALNKYSSPFETPERIKSRNEERARIRKLSKEQGRSQASIIHQLGE